VNFDGWVLGCCLNYCADFGNAFEEGLAAVLGNERMTDARAMLLGLRPAREGIPCSQCPHYKEMLSRGRWLSMEYINGSAPLLLRVLNRLPASGWIRRSTVWLANRRWFESANRGFRP
jgi:hypothetical protein